MNSQLRKDAMVTDRTVERQFKAAVRRMWALGDYHEFASATVWQLGPMLVQACGVSAGQRVLDVAAGTGNIAIRAAEAGAWLPEPIRIGTFHVVGRIAHAPVIGQRKLRVDAHQTITRLDDRVDDRSRTEPVLHRIGLCGQHLTKELLEHGFAETAARFRCTQQVLQRGELASLLGHRIRLSVASADFPNVWPTPEPGTNTVYFGGQVASCLVLPVVPPQGSARPPAFRPSPKSLNRHSAAPEPPTWRVEQDVLTGTTTVVVKYATQFRPHPGAVTDGDPACGTPL